MTDAKDAQLIKQKIELLNKALQKASTELYQKASAEQQKETEQKDDNVKDAEYTVDEDKK